MKILIVEDEQDLRETIRTSLLKEKFVVETAADYHAALDKINDYDYDCIPVSYTHLRRPAGMLRALQGFPEVLEGAVNSYPLPISSYFIGKMKTFFWKS